VARNPWRQGGSHYGEGARGDRREAVGGKTTDCGETANAVISFRLDSNEIARTPGDRVGATTVRGLGETVEKETVCIWANERRQREHIMDWELGT